MHFNVFRPSRFHTQLENCEKNERFGNAGEEHRKPNRTTENTNAMEQSPSVEANSRSAIRHPLHSRNRKVHCRVHNGPPQFHNLSQISAINVLFQTHAF